MPLTEFLQYYLTFNLTQLPFQRETWQMECKCLIIFQKIYKIKNKSLNENLYKWSPRKKIRKIPEYVPNNWCYFKICRRSQKLPVKFMNFRTSPPRKHLLTLCASKSLILRTTNIYTQCKIFTLKISHIHISSKVCVIIRKVNKPITLDNMRLDQTKNCHCVLIKL